MRDDCARVAVTYDAGGRTVVQIAGELEIANYAQVRSQLEDVGLQARTIALDLSELEFIDSSGLSVIVRLGNQLRERGGHLAVVGASPSIRRLFSITALDKRFALYDRLEDLPPDVPG